MSIIVRARLVGLVGISTPLRTRWVRAAIRVVLLVVLGLPLGIPASAIEYYDTVIHGGTIVDGTGGAPFEGAVAIRDQQIVAIGDLPPHQAREAVDASGLHISPGFIDLHSHADYAMHSNPLMPNLLQQGITSILAGNCGSSPDSIADALAFIDSTGTGPNMGFLIGHNTVRRKVLGEQDVPANSGTLAAMAQLTAPPRNPVVCSDICSEP